LTSCDIFDNIIDMLSQYLESKLKKARVKILKDGSSFASIPGIPGVWSNAKTKTTCMKELREVLEEWVLLKVRNHESIPGLAIKFDRRGAFRHA